MEYQEEYRELEKKIAELRRTKELINAEIFEANFQLAVLRHKHPAIPYGKYKFEGVKVCKGCGEEIEFPSDEHILFLRNAFHYRQTGAFLRLFGSDYCCWRCENKREGHSRACHCKKMINEVIANRVDVYGETITKEATGHVPEKPSWPEAL